MLFCPFRLLREPLVLLENETESGLLVLRADHTVNFSVENGRQYFYPRTHYVNISSLRRPFFVLHIWMRIGSWRFGTSFATMVFCGSPRSRTDCFNSAQPWRSQNIAGPFHSGTQCVARRVRDRQQSALPRGDPMWLPGGHALLADVRWSVPGCCTVLGDHHPGHSRWGRRKRGEAEIQRSVLESFSPVQTLLSHAVWRVCVLVLSCHL